MAEREGFEPPDPAKGQRFSRPPRSATLAPLRTGRQSLPSGAAVCKEPLQQVRRGLRPEAAEALAALRGEGVERQILLTGDREVVAAAAGKELGVDEVQANCFPDEKVKKVEEVKKTAVVAVVGDGVNDAPALAAGDVGVAFGKSASDIAVNSAAVAIMSNDLRRVPLLLGLAKASRVKMNINLGIGTLVIIAGITLSVFGWLPQMVAAVIHTVSTLLVIFNSAGLMRYGEEVAAEAGEVVSR